MELKSYKARPKKPRRAYTRRQPYFTSCHSDKPPWSSLLLYTLRAPDRRLKQNQQQKPTSHSGCAVCKLNVLDLLFALHYGLEAGRLH